MGGVISAAVSVSRDITNIMSAGSKSPAITYPSAPSVELTITKYYGGFVKFIDPNPEPGLITPIGMDIMLGDETQLDANNLIFLKGGNTAKTLRCQNMFLNNISYKFAVDGAFTTTLKYVGWMINSCTNSNDFAASLSGVVPTRRNYSITDSTIAGFPSSALTSISIDQSISRQYVLEFASRANYAAYMTLPIKSSVSLEGLASSSLTGYTFQSISNACNNFVDDKQDLKIATCGNGVLQTNLELKNTRLVSLGYSGGDASGGNMTVSASFEAFVDATDIITTWISTDADHTKGPCDC
jgi:hypothetical protein